MSDGPQTPPISIGVATGRGWPEIQPFVRSFETAAERADGELVVADGSGLPPPEDGVLDARTRWLSFPRSSVYSIRPALFEACRGEVVAVTEDHCRVEPGWAEALLQVHREYPDALVVGGPVENAATGRLVDWASYFVVQSGVIPPMVPGPRRRLAHANVSYKRAAIARAAAVDGLGLLDSFHQASLAVGDGTIRADPRPVVWHDQSLGLGGFVAQHFHAGRTWGSFVRADGGLRPMARVLGSPAVPLLRLTRGAAQAARSRHAAHLAPAMPAMLLLLAAQACGQVTGILLGPGDSPLKVEG